MALPRGDGVDPIGGDRIHSIQTTIPESVAPITIDRCVVTLQKMPAGNALLDDLDFTNVSQLAATEVRFAFRIVDGTGRTSGT